MALVAKIKLLIELGVGFQGKWDIVFTGGARIISFMDWAVILNRITKWGHNGSLARDIIGLAFPSEFRDLEGQREDMMRGIGFPEPNFICSVRMFIL